MGFETAPFGRVATMQFGVHVKLSVRLGGAFVLVDMVYLQILGYPLYF